MNIHDYLNRINYQGSLEPTLPTLRALHQAHLLAVPFENLSIHYGQPIILQEDLLFDKIVKHRRGGFCYELNGLFAWLLRQLGFQVSLLSAGVANPAGRFNPNFDHLTLLVHHLAGADWLADVGFGDSFRQPLRLEAEVEQGGADGKRYRLDNAAGRDEKNDLPYWILQQFDNGQWRPQYRFTLQPRALDDFTERCHFQQTSPDSHFTQHRICSLATPTGRITLSDMRFIITQHGERKEQELTDQREYLAILAQQFGVRL